ncbi:hypothetical protein DL767_011532 [Monosporascus sp. MG133]|nr:hypothetical protein DL767_011532 [Monosporascus sp. MG133]
MCTSHSSEERHVARARAMLAKAGADESRLRCGGHSALSDAVNSAGIRADYEPTGICNNGSGKHAGMLAGARAIGKDLADGYHLPEHPMQGGWTQGKAVQVPSPETFECHGSYYGACFPGLQGPAEWKLSSKQKSVEDYLNK